MHIRKKTISLLLSAALIFAASPMSKAISLDNSALGDIDSHWAEDDITALYRAGILNGDGSCANPDESITRGEFTALIVRALELDGQSQTVFGDVSASHMFYEEISAASAAGIINGMPDGNFYPENLITREEIMLIVSRCLKDGASSEYDFSDIDENYRYSENLAEAVSSGIISGYSDGTFRPNDNALRSEGAAMTIRLMKKLNGASAAAFKSLAKKYITSDAENDGENAARSVGSALDEFNLKADSAEIISSNGVTTEKSIKNLTLEQFSSEGLFATAKYSADIVYDVTYADSTASKREYACEITVDMITRDGAAYVYDYSLNLKKQDKINLTWEVSTSPPDYVPDGINVISTSSFHISEENLGVESTPLVGDISFYNALTSEYMNYANQNGCEVWAMYKTDFTLATSNTFLNSASARQKSLELLIKYACKYKIDGINIDFENVGVSDRALLTKHVCEVTAALHEMGLAISVDVTRKEVTSSVWSMCYDRDSLAETADYIMIMAYDEYYAGSSTPGSVSGLDWAEDTVKLTLNEIPSEKLILGIPLYMRYWEVTNGKVTSTKAISMQTAYNLIVENNPAYTWIESDKQYKISWKSGSKECMFWLENSNTISLRVDIANRYSLAGVATWRRGLEAQSIWNVISENLK